MGEKSLCSCVKKLNTVRLTILPKFICGFNTIPVKIPGDFFKGVDKLIMNSRWKCKRHRLANTVLPQSNKVEELTCFDFIVPYKCRTSKTARHWLKNGHTEQWKDQEYIQKQTLIFIVN